jgi:hypothetical protein
MNRCGLGLLLRCTHGVKLFVFLLISSRLEPTGWLYCSDKLMLIDCGSGRFA